MKAYILDISGKTLNYDFALYNAIRIKSSEEDDIKLFISNSPKKLADENIIRLLRLIPACFYNSDHVVKRSIKAVEGIFNYIYFIFVCFASRPDIIHFQWLPFLEVAGIESFFLKAIHVLSPKTRFILTVHNVYPHNMSQEAKGKYRKRFDHTVQAIDALVVHTSITKDDLIRAFNVTGKDVFVVPHGVFIPKGTSPTPWQGVPKGKWNLIMYGNQSYYKGTDILVNAMRLLPKDIKSRINLTICGNTPAPYYEQLKDIETGVEIRWIPTFVEDEVLYPMIATSDIILLPYREISQSGVLLLALHFRRAVIASDLPSFKETLCGFTEDMFCRAGDEASLAEVISNYMSGRVDIDKQLELIDRLNVKYSWAESARLTLDLYQSLCRVS